MTEGIGQGARSDRAKGVAVSAKFTVIDTQRGIAPRPGGIITDPQVRAHLAALQQKAEGRDAHGILELALTGEFAGKTAVVSSFGAESAVLLHLVAQIDPNTPILFLNTGKLFGETLRYRDRLQEALGLGDVRSLAPSLGDRASTIRKARCGRVTPMPAASSARPFPWPRRWRPSPPR